MNNRIDQLTSSLFQKNSIDDCSPHELAGMAGAYPYFAPARLLVAAKLKATDPVLFKQEVQTTSLYFHNSLWLDYLLNNEKFQQNEDNAVLSLTREHKNTETSAGKREETVDFLEPQPVAPEVTLSPTETSHEDQPATTEESHIMSDMTSPGEEEKSALPGVPVPPLPAIDLTAKSGENEPVLPRLQVEYLPGANADILFEPYHTVDYFASQGIKTDLDEKPKDRFGQQLKSFTEWLRAMKKLPAKDTDQHKEVKTDQQVQALAEHSIEDRDVVTEAMAEVWIKQGNRQKAIEVYNKLSLLNPAKSAYFAAKIEQLT